MMNLSTIVGIDPLHNTPSFLKLIDEDFPIFLEIPNDFASMVWGDHPPYKDSVRIVDGDNIWFVRVKKTDVGPVLADGFTKLVRGTSIRKDDYLMFQTYGPTSFFLMVFKSCVHKNMFISKINPHEDVIVMADEYWKQFYGKTFKGGQSTLYLGDRFWNVNMDGLSDRCVFSHGCSEMINELALDRRSTFVFSMHGNKVFELSVFNHQTGTQIQNNRVELVVLDDPIYLDDCHEFAFEVAHKEECIDAGTVIEEDVVVESEHVKAHLASFEDMFNDQDDAKFDTFFSSLLEMEDLKKKFKENWDSKTEGKGKSSVVCDVDSNMKDDPKAKSVVNVNEDISLKVVFVLLKLLFVNLTECDKNMSDMDLDSFLIPKDVMVNEPVLCSTVVSDFKENSVSKTEGKGKSSVDCDVDSTMKDDPKAKTVVNVNEDISLKDESMSDMDLDSFLIPKDVMVNEPILCSTVVSDPIMNNTVDVRQSVLPRKLKAHKKCNSVIIQSHESVIAHRTRSKIGNKKEAVVDKLTAVEPVPVCRKRSNLKTRKTDSFIEFTKVAEDRLKMDNRFKHQYSSSSEPSMNAVMNDYYTRWLAYVMKAHDARHRRKLRKLYLDNKRSRCTTQVHPYFLKGNRLNTSLNGQTSSLTPNTIKKNGKDVLHPSTTPNRTPLSNISNILPGTGSICSRMVNSTSGSDLTLNGKTNVVLQNSSKFVRSSNTANKENVTPSSCITNIHSENRNPSQFTNAMSSLNRISPGIHCCNVIYFTTDRMLFYYSADCE
ncbi:putative transcription factor B3-Domain family [Helianthus annuus]|nr:putative transcription factor B3-Domain family [Helianthus annuus]KAJ0625444.1 putative transcription factor B3-Domain family [Helianthus annuus]KAJ0803875.1 putative transcription factor B3-Domain family [Helianthus annuus]